MAKNKGIGEFLRKVQAIVDGHPEYKLEAYSFVMSALNYTVGKLKKPRHVTGKELLEGIKEYGLNQFGPLTRQVFEYWGIKTTEDFGKIVFNLVEAGLLRKTEEDTLDDFKNIYDFEEALDKNYKIDF